MYVSYVKSAGGWGWFTTCLFIFLANQACIQACDLWLTWWTDDTDGNSTPVGGGLSSNQHLYVYIGLIGLTGAINLVRGFTAYSRFQAASRVFHENLTANVMRAPMSFFDTTPLGRLINRFSKDIDQIDVVLPPTVITFFQLAIACTASIVVIATSQPILLAAMPFAGAIYVGVLKRFIRSNRETKRLDSISKSPIFQHFTETLAGIKTIWAYEVQTDFREHNRHLMDTNTRTSYANIACNRWLAIRLEPAREHHLLPDGPPGGDQQEGVAHEQGFCRAACPGDHLLPAAHLAAQLHGSPDRRSRGPDERCRAHCRVHREH
eukprot:Sspe_Gene.4962::Locus_1627_Transcript_1_3_Confidence_0.500_Length_4779::g.4962::m.4962